MKKKLLFVITMLLLLPFRVVAADATVSVTCSPGEVSPGSTVNCTVKGNSTSPVTAVDIPYSVNGGATVTGFDYDTAVWNQNGTANNKILGVPEDDLTGEFTVGVLKLKIDDNATSTVTVSLSSVFFSDSNFAEFAVNGTSTSITVKAVQNPTGLKSLSSTVATISPQFSSTETSYNLILPADATSFGFNYEANTSSDTVRVVNNDSTDGTSLDAKNITFSPKEGSNVMSISLIVGADSRQVTYTVLVTKNTSGEVGLPTLASLVVGGKTITITDEMKVNLDDLSNYQLTAVMSDVNNYIFTEPDLSQCVKNAGTLTCNLTGSNAFPITITSKTDTTKTKTYFIAIDKTGSSSEPFVNPQTGGSATIMAIVLVASLAASIYLYRKNIQTYSQ